LPKEHSDARRRRPEPSGRYRLSSRGKGGEVECELRDGRDVRRRGLATTNVERDSEEVAVERQASWVAVLVCWKRLLRVRPAPRDEEVVAVVRRELQPEEAGLVRDPARGRVAGPQVSTELERGDRRAGDWSFENVAGEGEGTGVRRVSANVHQTVRATPKQHMGAVRAMDDDESD
jgi:hypothetical protein